MEKNLFLVDMQVRAYECDFQGIVNNAVYMNYLEHARMCFGKHHGLCVVSLAEGGILWVVNRVTISYAMPLRAGDDFEVTTYMVPQGVMRIIFHQEIKKKATQDLVVKAEVITACLVNGRPVPFPASITDIVTLTR